MWPSLFSASWSESVWEVKLRLWKQCCCIFQLMTKYSRHHWGTLENMFLCAKIVQQCYSRVLIKSLDHMALKGLICAKIRIFVALEWIGSILLRERDLPSNRWFSSKPISFNLERLTLCMFKGMSKPRMGDTADPRPGRQGEELARMVAEMAATQWSWCLYGEVCATEGKGRRVVGVLSCLHYCGLCALGWCFSVGCVQEDGGWSVLADIGTRLVV